MKVAEFNFDLPEELIAQSPIKKRSDSRLLVLDRATNKITHHHFYEIVDMLSEKDVLVLNNTKVIPCRIFGEKKDTHAKIEILLLKNLGNDFWECLIKPFRRIHLNTKIIISDNLEAVCVEKKEEGLVIMKFSYQGIFLEILESLGEMPLPPYIHEKLKDKNRYQTIYAKELGSSAAPTAGLHFTEEIFEKLKEKKVTLCYLTLEIGLGTFRPVAVDDVSEHIMHKEKYSMSKETADILNEAKKNNKRIVAVGTTSTRTLESIFQKYQKFVECEEETNIFIYPGYEFRAIDALITNFHLPKSTLIMLVSAFASKEKILKAYEEAISLKYRFFSFGDAMFIK
ncbi:MAG: tRNA preQ1(34) S-adenosylmethionine ribosyltransferase-isomerase QueA [Bacilli bacterium]|jgi:S-adenosylmethionine:tRNA ribosyltransferase-isomerase